MFRKSITLHGLKNRKQDCIPVGCVPSACLPSAQGGVPAQGGGVPAQGGCTCPGGRTYPGAVPVKGVYMPRGVPAWGSVPAQGGGCTCPGGEPAREGGVPA